MTATPVLDLSPTFRLLLMGLSVAVGPLVWLWLRQRKTSLPATLRALNLLTLFLTFDLVLFGAFTRLTDSGLGCPDWPGCYGHASPVGAAGHIASAQAAMPDGPVTHAKAWIEMIHRYLASGVGVLILTLTIGAWWHALRRRESVVVSPWWPTLTLVWVCIQGAFGALTVTMRLFPLIVTLHLLGGMLLLALLTAQAVRYDRWHRALSGIPLSPLLRMGLWICIAGLILQIALGGWVSTNYAVMACADFPTCQGRWWPEMALSEGFQLWRGLGMSADGGHISFAALTGIHFMHRLGALALVPVLLAVGLVLLRHAELRLQAQALLALLGLQVLTGVGNVVLSWPLLGAVLHTGGAAGLLLVLTWLVCVAQGAPAQRALQPGLGAAS